MSHQKSEAPTTGLDLDAIRRRVPTHYPTPWQYERDADGQIRIEYATDNPLAGHVAAVPDYGWDLAEFIVAARTDVPALLAEVERLRRIVKLTTELTHDTDGEPLDIDTDIPVSEVMRALAGESL